MANENNPRTELSNLGEFGLIDRLTSDVKIKHKTTVTGIGDDAAVVDSMGRKTLITTDLLVEGVHFDLTYTPLRHLGYKAVIVNLSDIYAMNGEPSQITVGLAVSNRFPVEALDELYDGIRLACDRYGVDLAGGDTTTSPAGMLIAVTAVGHVDDGKTVYRKGACIHDLLCVSGDLGAAYLGLLLLEREKAVYKVNPEMQPDLEGHDYPLERQLKPEARRDVVAALRDSGVLPTSMIDISDGLASEILHLCRRSKVSCTLYEDKIPVDPTAVTLAAEFSIDPTTAALNGGEDYELLFTIGQGDYEKVRGIPDISIIGHITDVSEQTGMITRDGTFVPLQAQGWDAMRRKNQSM